MAYAVPSTVIVGDAVAAAGHNVIVNDIIDHETRIKTGVESYTTVQKTALGTPATGTTVYDSTLGVFQFYNGSVWVNAQGSPPSLTTVQKTALGTPATGTTVYDSTLAALQVYDGSAWVQRNLYLGNTTAIKSIRTGSTAATTDSSGVVSISTGLSTVDFFSVTHGTHGTVGNLNLGRNQASSGGTIYVKCFIAQTAAAYQNSALTIDWMAVGNP